jgi:copper chaperone NosL
MKRVAVTAVIVAGIGFAIWQFQQPPSGVVPVEWNEETCAHCKMHIGNKHFAAQLQTKKGEVHNFDDTGCLFEFVIENGPDIKQAYFHHYQKQKWLDYKEVGFLEIDRDTPMGYGIGAVNQHKFPDSMSFDEASNYVVTDQFESASEKARHKTGKESGT